MAHGRDGVRGATLALEYVPLETVRRWSRNPKPHDVGAIAASIQRFGFRDPLAANRRTKELEEGHGRVDALQAMKAQGRKPPPFVRADGTAWLVPVLWFDDDRETQEAYALAHNRTVELGGPYDQEGLARVLADLAAGTGLEGVGWDRDDLDAMLRGLRLDGELQRQEAAGPTVTCASCGKDASAHAPGSGLERVTCPECGGRLKESPAAAPGEGVTLVVVLLPEQRAAVLRALRGVQAARRLDSTGAALAWLCEEWIARTG